MDQSFDAALRENKVIVCKESVVHAQYLQAKAQAVVPGLRHALIRFVPEVANVSEAVPRVDEEFLGFILRMVIKY
jgi:hypothetical protein